MKPVPDILAELRAMHRQGFKLWEMERHIDETVADDESSSVTEAYGPGHGRSTPRVITFGTGEVIYFDGSDWHPYPQ
jgi:hypothetical protein